LGGKKTGERLTQKGIHKGRGKGVHAKRKNSVKKKKKQRGKGKEGERRRAFRILLRGGWVPERRKRRKKELLWSH